MKRFRCAAFALLAVSVFIALATSSASAATRLIVNCFWPPQHAMCQTILPTWGKWVEEATEGRVKISIPPKSLAAPPEQWASVEKGIADVAAQFNGFVQNRVWGPTVAMNPFIATTDAEAMSVALWETHKKYFPNEYKGVKLLALWVITPGDLWSQTDVPVNSIEELKKRKIWTLPGTTAAIMKSIGAGVVAGPAVQANEIISRGVVDAYVGLSPASVSDFQLIDYTKSMTQFEKGIYSTSFSVVINEQKWNALSVRDRAAIESVSGEKFGRMASQYWVESDKRGLDAIKKAGIKIVPADPKFEADLVTAGESLTKNWIDTANKRGIDGQATYDFYVSRVKALSRKSN